MEDNMHHSFFIYGLFSFCGSVCAGQSHFPDDINAFSRLADDCQYLAGEWDSSLEPERKIMLEKNITATFGKAEVVQKQLREKYKEQMGLLNVINQYDF